MQSSSSGATPLRMSCLNRRRLRVLSHSSSLLQRPSPQPPRFPCSCLGQQSSTVRVRSPLIVCPGRRHLCFRTDMAQSVSNSESGIEHCPRRRSRDPERSLSYEEDSEAPLSEYTLGSCAFSDVEFMSKDQLKSLGKKRVESSHSSCTVCHELYRKGEVIRILPCKHVFHYRCLKPWFRSSNVCPLCRLDVKQTLEEESCGCHSPERSEGRAGPQRSSAPVGDASLTPPQFHRRPRVSFCRRRLAPQSPRNFLGSNGTRSEQGPGQRMFVE